MDILKNISYCPPNVTIYDIWVNHGISHCWLDTVTTSVLAGFIVIFGTIQLIMYRRYATPVDSTQISTSKLYYLQLLLLTLIPSLSILRFILESFLFPDAHLYGYTVSIDVHSFSRKKICIELDNIPIVSLISFVLDRTDFSIVTNGCSIFLLNLFGGEREILLAAIGSNTWPWIGSSNFLDVCLCQ